MFVTSSLLKNLRLALLQRVSYLYNRLSTESSMRASVEEIELQIQRLHHQKEHLQTVLTLSTSHLKHLQAIEQVLTRMRDLLSHSRLRIMHSDSR